MKHAKRLIYLVTCTGDKELVCRVYDNRPAAETERDKLQAATEVRVIVGSSRFEVREMEVEP